MDPPVTDWNEMFRELAGAPSVRPGGGLPAAAPALIVRGLRDLSPLTGVRGLRALFVADAPPAELARIGHLAPGIETLVVGGRDVTHLGYLAGVGRLRSLGLAEHIKLRRLDGIEARVTTLPDRARGGALLRGACARRGPLAAAASTAAAGGVGPAQLPRGGARQAGWSAGPRTQRLVGGANLRA